MTEHKDALTASSSQPVGESRGDEPSLRDVTEAELEAVAVAIGRQHCALCRHCAKKTHHATTD